MSGRRLGLLVPGFSASEEDWCIPALLDLVRALAAEDDVRVFALRHPAREERYSVAGAEVIPFGGDGGGAWGRVLRFRRVVRTIVAEHRRRPFDLLHAFWAHEPGALGALAAARIGRPLVVSVLGGELVHLPAIRYGGGEGPLNRHLASFALSRARLVTAGSRFLLAEAAERVAEDRLALAPLGVSTERFFPARAPRLEGAPALLSVASLVPVKGHAVLLDALARVAATRPGAVLHLAGKGVEGAALLARAGSLGVAGRLRLHGELPHDALPALYRGADLVVVPSLFESQCLAALEAAACGTPVAGSAVGILPEIVPQELLAPPGNAAELAAAIEAGLAPAARAGALRAPLPPGLALAGSVARWRELHARL